MNQEPASPESEGPTPYGSELSTPLTTSAQTSPTEEHGFDRSREPCGIAQQKKKKKKKPKKSATAKAKEGAGKAGSDGECRPPLLCISRNKHWRYISSYHGPWLQLPLELLESLLVLNADPATLAAESRMAQMLPPLLNMNLQGSKKGDRPLGANGEERPIHNALPPIPPPPLPTPKPGKATPPPIDPGVFRSVTTIRDLIDEAAELSVRASSGLSAAELSSMRNSSVNGSAWAAAQSLGLNPLGMGNGNGRNVAMSAMRIHRLRALAVQKLAEAYKTDEIASSVMVMQGGSVFDDLAERVLKVGKYVHFFHEKIPSRQLAESTTTKVLDDLIAQFPQRLQYFRTRGIVHCFREEFSLATKDFTHALKEARAIRKAKQMHHIGNSRKESRSSKSGKRKKSSTTTNSNGQAPPNGTSVADPSDGGMEGGLVLHPSVLPDAPDPIEPQCLFLRGAAYLQNAVHLIESAVLQLEGVRKGPTVDGAELRLCYIDNGKYGGVEIGNPDGPLGSNQGPKVQAYNQVLAESSFREHISSLLRKSMRDHERFLAHFDSIESPNAYPEGDIASRIEYAVQLSDTKRPPPDIPPVFTTYHPLLVESMYSVLICLLMLGDFSALLPQFVRFALVVDGLEGYPVFLPPRSMGQAEFMEILERLAGGWKNGIQQHSLSTQRGKSRLAIEAPPSTFPRPATPSRSSSMGSSLNSPLQASSSASISRKGSFVTGSSFESSGSSSFAFSACDTSTSHDAGGTATPSSSGEFADYLEDNISRTSSPPNVTQRPDAEHALDCARILLNPIVKKQKERAEKAAAEKAAGGKKKPAPINIPLHGPRVEVVLAWLGAVVLPELDV
ncbi:hypothetical protein CC1G_00649 [Coprinopsis cinerea okayama7|uniref:Uncharacterized protein n=1 Tax=Coprinopsis cinerea (strain Okayama-7 / 130 / ATCC MYA-4618 / FGSC 9003) TaxID=240176 RepID=A8N3E5_COPC7|nr:hypothetical protein CC1G_00649 [Coprinopsis cinerea okayama7\|eukprot:XP_001829470.1 hypothetical protein CC1G_00649 [Coprinopsis cinerea okayama7\